VEDGRQEGVEFNALRTRYSESALDDLAAP
jgi:hypothetical protein